MNNKKYSDEFKEMIIELSKSGKAPSEIMREYGISSSVYYKWLSGAKTVTVNDEKFTAKDVKALKREISLLKEENEILKKAMTIFAGKRN